MQRQSINCSAYLPADGTLPKHQPHLTTLKHDTSLAGRIMANSITVFRLANGSTLPAIGPGTFQGNDGNEKVKNIVEVAIQAGYHHIDGAAAYEMKRLLEILLKKALSREMSCLSPLNRRFMGI